MAEDVEHLQYSAVLFFHLAKSHSTYLFHWDLEPLALVISRFYQYESRLSLYMRNRVCLWGTKVIIVCGGGCWTSLICWSLFRLGASYSAHLFPWCLADSTGTMSIDPFNYFDRYLKWMPNFAVKAGSLEVLEDLEHRRYSALISALDISWSR